MMRGLRLAAALVFASGLSAAPAPAATFLLESGETVEGAIIAATRNTVTIRSARGGMRQIPVGRLERLEIKTADGQRLRGNYHGWLDGRAGIEVGSEVLWLENDRVVARAPLATPALTRGAPPAPAEPAIAAAETAPTTAPAAEPGSETAGTEPASGSAETEPTTAAAETEPPSTSAAAEPESESAGSEPASPPAPAWPADRGVASVIAPMPPGAPLLEPSAGPETAALPARDLPAVSVTTAPDEVTEKSGEIVFTLELSRPIDDLLVVIYSTVDGAARAGADYQASHGILTLPAGATREQFRTTVIDDSEAENDEEFQLFVATNPELTEVAQQWLEITIRDDD
ncbi:MAG TPA: Calx-beta domain-containing protein [Geminicoccaceae bacterium]|nr:Calx-beta domain-containing protein [Geminicoccaceae bacterium]